MDKYIAIGRVSKTHGVDGALKLKIKDRYWDDFAEAKVLFVESAGKVVPYFIEEFRGGHDPIVKFEDLDQREPAQALSGKKHQHGNYYNLMRCKSRHFRPGTLAFQCVAGKQRVQKYLAREETEANFDCKLCQQERHERCSFRHLPLTKERVYAYRLETLASVIRCAGVLSLPDSDTM